MNKNVLYPGNTLGIMGCNRNGKRLIAAAKNAGLNVGVYLDHPAPGITKMADFTIIGNYRDKDKLQEFGNNCDAVLYETATIDAIVFHYLEKMTRVVQGIEPLEIMQDRVMERTFLDQINVNVAPYETVLSLDDIYDSIDSIGYPAVLRPIQRGMGENSLMINLESDIARASDFIQGGTYLLESWIDHAAEYSIMVAIDEDGGYQFPLVENEYDGDRRLVAAKSPATVPDDIYAEMKRIVDEISQQLNYRGLLSINFYVTSTGNLYMKDMEPGISTAGNVYAESCNVTQCEQEIRIASGRPVHFIQEMQPAIFMIGRQKQLSALERQELIRDNWKISFFPSEKEDAEAVCAYVWATGKDVSLDELQNQIDDTEVWDAPDDRVDGDESAKD